MEDKKISLSEFNIQQVDELCGCEQAITYLKAKYGETTDDLRTRKADIIELLDKGKISWVINFCLHIVTIEKQYEFLKYLLQDLISHLPDSESEGVFNFYKLFVSQLEGANLLEQLFELYEIMFNFNNSYKGKTAKELKPIERYMLERNRAFMRMLDLHAENPIKACITGSNYIIRAELWNQIVDYPDTDPIAFKAIKEKDHGLYAMKLTEIWPND